MLYTRRDIGKIALASVPLGNALAVQNSKFHGVQIGAITYSLRGMSDIDQILKALVDSGLSETELMSNHAEQAVGAPAPAGRGGGGQGREDKDAGRGLGRCALRVDRLVEPRVEAGAYHSQAADDRRTDRTSA